MNSNRVSNPLPHHSSNRDCARRFVLKNKQNPMKSCLRDFFLFRIRQITKDSHRKIAFTISFDCTNSLNKMYSTVTVNKYFEKEENDISKEWALCTIELGALRYFQERRAE